MKKLLILLTMLVLLLTSCSKSPEQDPDNGSKTQQSTRVPELTLTKREIKIEYGSKEPNPEEWIVTGTFDSLELPKIDTMKVGKQTHSFSAIVGDEKVTKVKDIEVVDTHDPTFTDSVTQLEIEQGQDVDLSTLKASDKVDGDLKVSLKEKVDTSKVGKHKIIVFAEDKNKNKVEKELVLVIKEKGEVASVDGDSSNPSQNQGNTQTPSNPAPQQPSQPGVTQPSPQPQPEPAPSPSPQPQPEPVPEPTPEPEPQPEPTPEPEPQPEPAPSCTPSWQQADGYVACEESIGTWSSVLYAVREMTDSGFAELQDIGHSIGGTYINDRFVRQWSIHHFGFTNGRSMYGLMVTYR